MNGTLRLTVIKFSLRKSCLTVRAVTKWNRSFWKEHRGMHHLEKFLNHVHELHLWWRNKFNNAILQKENAGVVYLLRYLGCKHQILILANMQKKLKGFNERIWLLTELKGRLREVQSSRAAEARSGGLFLLGLGSVSFLLCCPWMPNSDSCERQFDWNNLGSYTHMLAD